LSVSLPWGDRSTVSYNTTVNRNDTTHSVGYYDRFDEHNTYQVNVGSSRTGVNASGYLQHEGDVARLSGNASYRQGRYSAVGLTAQGGMT
ncbi:fimbria/pilus outer membrane usher protein, partial [Bacillus wiedmannii]